MRSSELLRIAWTALYANKLRSLLTTLGIVIAVWTIVSVRSVIAGMNSYVRDQVITLSPDVFVVNRFGIMTSLEDFVAAMKRREVSDREIVQLGELCQSCAEIGAHLGATLAVHAGNRRIPDVPIQGTTANVARLLNLDIAEGRYFSDFENQHARPVAVIGSEIREELFPRVDPIGRPIWVGSEQFRIIGVKSKQGSVLGHNQDVTVYVPYRRASMQFGNQRGRRLDITTQLFVRAKGGVDDVGASEEEVLQVFRWLRHTPFKAPDPIAVVTGEMVQTLYRQVTFASFMVMTGISLVSLLVGAIVVANIMIVSVVERTREIGLRLALGARKRDIRRQFLVESAILALVGGAIGAALGGATAWVVDANAPVPAEVTAPLIATAMVLAAVTGLAAGFFPARKAANLTPIEALHDE